ncbi:MAG: ThuA domain-containing protein [Gammaproteobacteria bacterium]|nr:ThuA domain-containing protein [Gammaproteobacteria bacterium]
MAKRAHLITGGFPIGSHAGHDMDYVRIELLNQLYTAGYQTTSSSDFSQIGERLAECDLLLTYVAGPYPGDEQCEEIENWLRDGGKWFALHGTSGGRAARIGDGRRRGMVRLTHHSTLGAFFLNHPPIRKFRVQIENSEHPIFNDLPEYFDVEDELYLIEPYSDATPLMTTELPEDTSPPGFGFVYDEDTSIQADGKTRVLATERKVGVGSVVYVALGHCHSPANNSQPFVDESVSQDGETPKTFRGVWANQYFRKLIDNALDWAAA